MKPLDNLCHPVSVIGKAQKLAADAFGAGNAFFMVNGTTSAVQAMILYACKEGEKIIMPRNVHRSAINALIVSGAIPVYVDPGIDANLGIPLGMSVKSALKAMDENPDAKAVLVNNPTYYGVCSDLRSIVSLAPRARNAGARRRGSRHAFLFFEPVPSIGNGMRRRLVGGQHAQVWRKPHAKFDTALRKRNRRGQNAPDNKFNANYEPVVLADVEPRLVAQKPRAKGRRNF